MYENNKDIGWKKKNNSSSNGGYDDSLIKNQINVLDNKIEDKQDELISGSNIKTINGQSILGSGDITIKNEDVDLSEYITETELNDKGYLTEHQSLVGYATKSYVDNQIQSIEVGETEDNIASLTAKNTDNAMVGMKLGCIGDSITAGTGVTSGTLYGHLIKDAKDLSSVQMIGYPSEGYTTIYHKLSELNEDCDIIIELIGVNNRENNYVFNPENFDTNTVEGALNSTMKYLKENFANKGATVLICTPIQPLPDGNFGAENIWCIANLKIKYAELYGLPVCDLFHDSFFNTMNMSNEDRNTYIPDGIHPNSKGHEKLAECMLKTLNDLAVVPTVQMYKHDKKVFPFVKEEDISDVNGVALATKLQSILARLSALEANGGGTPVIPIDSISLEPTNISIDVGNN